MKNQLKKAAKKAIIVGGGLAGGLLGMELLERGWEVSLWDDHAPEGASRVAAGLFNVITGRFGAKSWQADLFLQTLSSWLEKKGHEPFRNHIHYIPIYRPFKSVKEYNKWQGRALQPEFAHLVDIQERPWRPETINNELGGIWIKPCGWVDVSKLTEVFRNTIAQHPNGRYVQAAFDYQKINTEAKCYQSEEKPYTFDQLIFCEGYRITQNPFFPTIPIIPNKGEILRVHAPTLKLEVALSRKIYIVPNGDDQYSLGSTYANQFDHTGPTEEGKNQILENLATAANIDFEIIEHKAGIRPTTPDRRPILGSHTDYPWMHVLSGFGTKGVLQGPYCAQLMADYLESGGASGLPEEVSPKRFG
jgi:glycine/D-amino acid oxidase-like deaminating enzyme